MPYVYSGCKDTYDSGGCLGWSTQSQLSGVIPVTYFLDDFAFPVDFVLPCRWDRALPAADLDVLLVRRSRKVFDAADAAFPPVVFLGALRCESALPAALFDFMLVPFFCNVLEAEDAAFLPVTLLCAMDRILDLVDDDSDLRSVTTRLTSRSTR